MIKQLFWTLLLFFAGSAANAATYTAADCTVLRIQAAANLASDGDTVLVPASAHCPSGNPTTWTTVLSITKGITLNGQGAYIAFDPSVNQAGHLRVTTDSVANSIITGFNFSNEYGNGTGACPIDITVSPTAKAFRFYNNTYRDGGSEGGGTAICVEHLGPGLIDHDLFTPSAGGDEVIHFNGTVGDNWSDDVAPGGSSMIYVENIRCQNNSTVAEVACEEAFMGAEFVWRYNLLICGGNDIHDGDGGRWHEIYGNTYNVTCQGTLAQSDYAQIRGSSGLYYSNHVTGTPCCGGPFPGVSYGPNCPSSDDCGSWPRPKWVGTGVNTNTRSPAYLWDNDAKVQSNISSRNGILIGTAPTDAANCSAHTNNQCDVVKSSSQPSLVKCQTAADVMAGCPVSYTYTPYTYPHPLDNCSTSVFGVDSACGSGASANPGTQGLFF